MARVQACKPLLNKPGALTAHFPGLSFRNVLSRAGWSFHKDAVIKRTVCWHVEFFSTAIIKILGYVRPEANTESGCLAVS